MSRVRHEEQYVRREEQPDLIEGSPSAPLYIPSAPLRPARRSPRRVFSWVAAIAAVLVIALITTALVASHHPAGPTTGKPHPTTNVTPPPSVTVYGSAYNDLSSTDSTIFALDGTTGKPRWTHSDTTFRVRPVVQDGVFYIGASDGSVSAYRASDGKLLWSQKLLTNSVVQQVVDGVVYAYSLDKPVGQVQPASLYALDARTGQQLWHFTKGAGGIIVGGVIYFAGASDVTQQHGAVYALNAKDGSTLWEFQERASSASVSQVVDGLVYVTESTGSDRNVTVDAVDAATGQQRWSYPRSPVGQMMTLGVDNGLLYLLSNEGAGSSDVPPRELYAVNTSDGSVRWHVELELGHVLALYDNGVIYVGMDDAIAAYRASDGQLLWKNTTTRNEFPDLVAKGVLYLYNADTAVDAAGMLAIDTATGKTLWQYASGQSLFVKAVVNGLVYAITFETPGSPNTIYALDVATGKVRWTYDLGREFDYYLVVS